MVLVDELEALARGVFELERKLFDFLARRLGVELAGLLALLELGRERGLDRFLPARNVDQLAAKPPVPPREMRRRRHKVSGSETHHSMASIVPSLSVSSTANAASSRDGTNRYWRFLLPQFVRKLITSWSARTARRISSFSSVPESSLSIIWNALRARPKNSVENSSSAAVLARSRRSRSFSRSLRRLARPRLIAVSLRATGVMFIRVDGVDGV